MASRRPRGLRAEGSRPFLAGRTEIDNLLCLMSALRSFSEGVLFFMWLGDFEGVFAGLFGLVKRLVAPAGNIIRRVLGVILAQAHAYGDGDFLFSPDNG
jgi:hypothetical protein